MSQPRVTLKTVMPDTPQSLRQTAVSQTLRRCTLFTGLATNELQQVAGFTTLKSLERDAFLFHAGEPTRGFYIVQSGAIVIARINSSGKEQVIQVFRPGQSFAEATLVSESGYPADARALEPTTVLLVQRAAFVEFLRQHPDLSLRMLASMAIHLRALVGQIDDLTLKDVETRLAHWLLRQCPHPDQDQPITVEIAGTKRALAAELGTVSETFSRTLARLRDQGLIAVDGPQITLLSPPRLRDLIRQRLGE